jgi:hypothetical protein
MSNESFRKEIPLDNVETLINDIFSKFGKTNICCLGLSKCIDYYYLTNNSMKLN